MRLIIDSVEDGGVFCSSSFSTMWRHLILVQFMKVSVLEISVAIPGVTGVVDDEVDEVVCSFVVDV